MKLAIVIWDGGDTEGRKKRYVAACSAWEDGGRRLPMHSIDYKLQVPSAMPAGILVFVHRIHSLQPTSRLQTQSS